MDDFSLGDRELEIMTVLWELGSGTATEVRDRVTDDLAYNTVLTLLRRLETKGYLRRKAEGKAHRYFPAVARRTAERSAIRKVVDQFFSGSAEELVARLVEERKLSAAELDRLRKRVAALTRGSGR